MPWHDADVSIERVGYGLEGVETEVILTQLYPRDVWAFDFCHVCDLLLRHAFFLPQRGNVVAYTLPLLFLVYHLDVIVFTEVARAGTIYDAVAHFSVLVD